VTRVAFSNAESGYAVVRADVEGEAAPVSMCGAMHGVKEGDLLEVIGRWTVHERYGEQVLVAQSARADVERMANSPRALAVFLSKTVRGVGPAISQRIVAHFGEQTRAVLDMRDERELVRVKGVSPRIAKIICGSWGDHGRERDCVVELTGMEVPFNLHARVIDRWGAADAARVVKENPYRMTTDLGVGFPIVDRLAQRLGRSGPLTDPERYGAAALHALWVAEGQGHCCLPQAELLAAALLLLESKHSPPLAEKTGAEQLLLGALEQLAAREKLVAVRGSSGMGGGGLSSGRGRAVGAPGGALGLAEQAVQRRRREWGELLEDLGTIDVQWYTVKMATAENAVAAGLHALLGKQPHRGPDSGAGPPAGDELLVEDDAQMLEGLTLEQRMAVQAAVGPAGTGGSSSGSGGVIITGGPGCGKTFIMKTVVEILRARGVQVALAAPTGRAAQRLTELVGLADVKPPPPAGTPSRRKYRHHRAKQQAYPDDDSGAATADIGAAVTIHRLLEYRPNQGWGRGAHNPLSHEVVVVDEASMLDIALAKELLSAMVPGNKRLVIIGDPDQLPSIGAGQLLRDALAAGTLEHCRLTKVFRQKASSSIIAAAQAINRSDMPSYDVMPIVTAAELIASCRNVEATRRRDSAAAVQGLKGLAGGGECLFVTAEHAEQGALAIQEMLRTLVPVLGHNAVTDVQVLTPGHNGPLGTRALNQLLRPVLNPQAAPAQQLGSTRGSSGATSEDLSAGAISEQMWGRGDKVIQMVNNYDKDVYNGDIGFVIDHQSEGDGQEETAVVEFSYGKGGHRQVTYGGRKDLKQLLPAWAITVHKAQGSEYPVVFVPLTMHHTFLLSGNLLYTAITRAQALCVFVGERRVVYAALGNHRGQHRHTGLVSALRRCAEEEIVSRPRSSCNIYR
jgi:exodeoxyribonuclease V alpha subunit